MFPVLNTISERIDQFIWVLARSKMPHVRDSRKTHLPRVMKIKRVGSQIHPSIAGDGFSSFDLGLYEVKRRMAVIDSVARNTSKGRISLRSDLD
jgi:hypothetical protein